MTGFGTDAEDRPKGLIASASRALKILEVVAESGDGVMAKTVARRTGLNLSTTYEFLNTLVYEGYLVRLPHQRGFGIGYKLFELHRNLGRELNIVPTVSHVLQDLHMQARAPLYFTIFRDTSLVIADIADSELYPRAQPTNVGFTEASHASAYGKLLLAWLPPERRSEYLQGAGMARLTKGTLTSKAALEQRLENVRHAGVALEVEEFQPNLACMAVPVVDGEGVVRGAVATSGDVKDVLSRRWELERCVKQAAARVTRVLVASSPTATPDESAMKLLRLTPTLLGETADRERTEERSGD